MNYKKCLNWIGSGLALLGSVFVIYRLFNYGVIIKISSIGIVGWLIISSFIMVYGTANILLALSWRQILAYLNINVALPFAIHTYGISQLAKYIPGNIFHLAGRQSIGVAADLPGWNLAKSAIWEIATLAFTAGLFGIIVLPLLVPILSAYMANLLFAITLISVLLIAKRFVSIHISYAIAYYSVFLALSGFIFVAIITMVAPENNLQLVLILPLTGAYVIAWLAGLITPGAPAGVGIREMVLLFILQQYINETHLLSAIVIGRIVTVGGDFIFYLISMLLFRNIKNFFQDEA